MEPEYLKRGNKPPFKDVNADNPIQPLCRIHKRRKNKPAQLEPSGTLLTYGFTTDASPTFQRLGIVGTNCVNGSLTSFLQASPGYATDPVFTAKPASGATSEALAVTNSSYFSFSIAPAYGKRIRLDTLTFNAARINANTPTGYGVRSSLDNYATDIATANLGTARTTFTAVSLDLSGALYQMITTPITFRIYIYGPAVTDGVDVDDINIKGFVMAA